MSVGGVPSIPSSSGGTAVAIQGLSKSYKLGQLLGLATTARRALGRTVSTPEPFEALHGVTFEVAQGECFGIVGHNGSGKSTLMQILAGITLPSAGRMVIQGRVLPLLAVGSSFHPELTGRENVLLFGSILGVPRQTALGRMDEIAAFAEIEQHLDTPNKRYSDGMQARLSFGVAMLFPADIYLFDEVLAVVDGDFRARCLKAIDDLVEAGKTVIFISHDMGQVEHLCGRVAWMESGHLQMVGPTRDVLAIYSQHATV